MIAAGVIAVACVATALIVEFSSPSVHAARLALLAVTLGALLMLAAAVMQAQAAGRQQAQRVRTARLVNQRGQAELQQMVERIMRGEQPAPLVPVPSRAADGDPFRQLTSELEQAQYHAGQAVLRVADKVFGGRSDQRVEIFVNLARRMQSLVHREIELLDDLEAKVEDPELLKGLFTVDHLATRMRRQSESLAVLGGSSSRRQWSRQVTMHEVLRAAVAEVEQYSRVKVVPPVEGVLRGGAVTDVIHLIAELVENATKFSAPHTTALLRAQHVSAGVAIEIEDRGLGILSADQQRMNDLLADPGRMDVDELLRDGRIGLYVVAALARRHGIRVRLQNNIYGGTQAVVVLPKPLLELSDRGLPRPEHDEQNGNGNGNGTSPRLALVPTGAGLPAVGPGSTGGLPKLAQPGERGDGRAPLPVRHPAASGAAPAPVGPPSTPNPWAAGPSAVSAWAPEPVGDRIGTGPRSLAFDQLADEPERPPLPRRQVQAASPSPLDSFRDDSLRDEHGGPAVTRSTEPPADQMTGLMADFLRGTRRAEDEDSPARD